MEKLYLLTEEELEDIIDTAYVNGLTAERDQFKDITLPLPISVPTDEEIENEFPVGDFLEHNHHRRFGAKWAIDKIINKK